MPRILSRTETDALFNGAPAPSRPAPLALVIAVGLVIGATVALTICQYYAYLNF